MPHTITPTDGGDVVSITVASDGDFETASSVEVSFQAVANLAAYCRAFVRGTRSGAILPAPIVTGAAAFQGSIVGGGSGADLNISQAGETTHILGHSDYASGHTHQFNGALVIAGGASVSPGFGLAVPAAAELLLGGTLTPGGAGHILTRPPLTPAPGDFTVGVDTADSVILPNQVADHICTLTSLHAGNGATMTISGYACAAFKITVKDDGGGQIGQAIQNVAGHAAWVDYVFSGGVWAVLRQEEVT